MEQISSYRNTDEVANALFEENKDCVPKVTYRYRTIARSTQDMEDMNQIAYAALWTACMTYDPSSEAKFFTYAYICMKNAILKYKDNRFKYQNLDISLDETIGHNTDEPNVCLKDLLPDPNSLNFMDKVSDREFLDNVIDKTCRRLSSSHIRNAEEAFRFYCKCVNEPNPITRTAIHCNVSKQRASQLIAHALTIARKCANETLYGREWVFRHVK